MSQLSLNMGFQPFRSILYSSVSHILWVSTGGIFVFSCASYALVLLYAEVITSAEFHPTHCNTLAYSSSKGSIRLVDLRQSALCDTHSQM
jgi:hypothetical protein